MGGALGGTPTTTLSHTRDKQVSKDTSISDDIQVPDGTSSKSKKEKVEKEKDIQKLIDFFNETTQGVFGTIRPPLNATRKAMLKARIAEHGQETFEEVVRMAMESEFLKGQNDKCWRATFDWLIKPTNFDKVLSGNYTNREKPTDHYKGDDTIGKNFVRRGFKD